MTGDGANAGLQPAASGEAHLADIVRAGDRDRYWASLASPAATRRHLLALLAFNIELSRIGEQVREPQLGDIRLQWWRDALEQPAGTVTGHPVADALRETRDAHGLPAAALDAMIEARGIDARRESIATMDDLRAYLIASAGGVFRLGAWITGARGAEVDAASDDAAMAYGLAGLMRALPYHAARGQVYLPAEFLGAFGITSAQLLAGEGGEALRTALGVLGARGNAHLAAYRDHARHLPPAALPVFLPLALVPAYLRRLTAPTHRPLQDIAQLNPLASFLRIWFAGLRGKAV